MPSLSVRTTSEGEERRGGATTGLFDGRHSSSRLKRRGSKAGEPKGPLLDLVSLSSSPTASDEAGRGGALASSSFYSSLSKTVSLTALPPFLAYNKFVHRGYRPHPSPSRCHALLAGLFALHNETLNIYAHLLPAAVCFWWAVRELLFAGGGGGGGGAAGSFFPSSSPSSPSFLYALAALADAASGVCFLASTAYHALMPAMRTQGEYDALIKSDVWGVWCVNLGAGLSLTLLLFPCTGGAAGGGDPPSPSPSVQSILRLALVLVPAVGSFVWVAFMARSPASRAASFAICWALRYGSIVATAALGASPWPRGLLLCHLVAELFSPLGAVINVVRWPERHLPGRLDYFNSHTLMHCMVAVGMLSQHYLNLARADLIVESGPGAVECARREWGWAVDFGAEQLRVAAWRVAGLLLPAAVVAGTTEGS